MKVLWEPDQKFDRKLIISHKFFPHSLLNGFSATFLYISCCADTSNCLHCFLFKANTFSVKLVLMEWQFESHISNLPYNGYIWKERHVYNHTCLQYIPTCCTTIEKYTLRYIHCCICKKQALSLKQCIYGQHCIDVEVWQVQDSQQAVYDHDKSGHRRFKQWKKQNDSIFSE